MLLFFHFASSTSFSFSRPVFYVSPRVFSSPFFTAQVQFAIGAGSGDRRGDDSRYRHQGYRVLTLDELKTPAIYAQLRAAHRAARGFPILVVRPSGPPSPFRR
jgi:hypothetical protein